MPAGLYENNTSGTGSGGADPVGPKMRTCPLTTVDRVPPIINFCDALGGIEYETLLAVVDVPPAPPAMIVTLMSVPVGPTKDTVPFIAVSVGLTRRICVLHPAPSAKCGMTTVPVLAAADRSTTGSVDIK